VIGVVGGPGVGKTTLIEALAGDAKAEVTRDEKGNAATVWRGIRFVEQPGEHNADGLVEIRMADVAHHSQGRPLVIIENVRVNLHDGFAFDRFVKDPDDFLGPAPRFDDDETVPRVHLPAFSLATRPEHKGRGPRLREISRFDLVERALARRLHSRAKLLRIQRFLDDLIEAILPLRDYALTVNLQSHLEGKAWQGRLAEMTSDMTKWGDAMRASIKENAALPFASLRGQLEAFANKHAGDRHIEELWSKRVAGLPLAKHVEEELKRLEASYKATAGNIIESSKATRQPGEGPLPQPVLMSTVPNEFREATAAFRAKLGEVIDPIHWVTFPEAWEPAVDATTNFAEDKDKLLASLTKRIDKMERQLAQDLETRFVGGVLAPVEKKLTTESRSLLDALFNLGREGHTMLGVVNEVLLSLVQRLIERAAESHSIRLPLIQKIVREPGHRTKLLVPPSRDLFPLARRLQEALGERVDLISAVESTESRIAHALMPAKIKPDMIKINEEKRMAQVRIPRGESGKAFGRNGANQRLAAALVGYHLHLRIAKDNEPSGKESEAVTDEKKAAGEPKRSRQRSRRKGGKGAPIAAAETTTPGSEAAAAAV
jgi:transcription antitermination factor NusA-like protein